MTHPEKKKKIEKNTGSCFEILVNYKWLTDGTEMQVWRSIVITLFVCLVVYLLVCFTLCLLPAWVRKVPLQSSWSLVFRGNSLIIGLRTRELVTFPYKLMAFWCYGRTVWARGRNGVVCHFRFFFFLIFFSPFFSSTFIHISSSCSSFSSSPFIPPLRLPVLMSLSLLPIHSFFLLSLLLL